MKNLFTCLSKKSLSNGNGSGMDRDCISHASALPKKFIALLCLLFMVGVGSVWGSVDVVSYTFATANSSNTGYVSTYDLTIDGKNWNVPGNQNFSGYVRIGGKNLDAVDRVITGQSTITDAITKITLNHGGRSNASLVVNSIKIEVASNSDFSTIIDTKTISSPSISVSTDGSFNFTPTAPLTAWAANSYYRITINVTNADTKNNYGFDLKNIVFYKTIPSYTVTWQSNGVTYTTSNVGEGYKPEFPAVNPTSCDTGEGASTTFHGWTTSTWSGKKDDVSAYTIYTKADDMPAVTGAITYNAVFCKGGDTEVLNEEFDNSSESDSNTKITTSSYTNFSGSTNNAYPSRYGGLKLGAGDYVGYITSKSLDLSSKFTVSIDARVYGTDGADISVTVGETTKTISNSSFGTTGYNTCVLNFEAATSTSTVYITSVEVSSKRRVYIDNIVITRIGTRTKFMTTCCDGLGSISESVTLTKTTRTMTATWSKTSGDHETGYSVQLYDNNGSGAKGSAIGDPVSITGKETDNRTHTFEGLTPNHQYFVGVTPTYSGDGDYCDEGTEVTGNATTDAGYTVTYAHGTGATGEMTDTNSPYDAGATVTVLTNTFENCGAVFNAWSAKKADETAIVVSSGSFTMPASNVTITATWTNKQDKFYDYMHENHPGGSDYYSRSGTYTTPAALDNTTPGDGCEGKHYKFMGWVEADYINEDGTLKPGFTLIPASESGHCADNKTFYAIWAEEE